MITRQLFGIFAWLAAILAWPVASVAQDAVLQDPTLVELTTGVPGHTGISFFDLVKQVIPDLARNENGSIGHRTVTLRHIAGDGFGGSLPDPIKIGVLRALLFESEGKPRIAMLLDVGKIDDLGEQPALLAVFDAAGRMPTLLDAVDIGLDRVTSLAEPALVRIGERDHAILTTSQHFNSAENYTWTALIFLRGGKLSLIDKFLAYNAHTCPLRKTQAFSFDGEPGENNAPYYEVTVTMSDEGTLPEEDCYDIAVGTPYARSVSATYRWDADEARFVADSDAVERLQEETGER
ncbi:hypothetical protein [Rhizobium leguminosarum]|uniref:hypothetical protein n=1 Tax=Rhizobium leguminosarum TaxID=384 RepID=UPI0011AE8325|nr:hypothetical protein [Rhizobium leguminosarum]